MDIAAINHPHITLAAQWVADQADRPHMADTLPQVEAGARAVSRILYTAQAYGWTIEYRPAAGRYNPTAYVLTRPGERIVLGLAHSGHSVATIRGDIATGPVSTTHVDRHGIIREQEVTALLAHPAHADYPDTEWVLVVGPGYTERRHYETACNYAEYRVEPGVYPVQLSDSYDRPVAPGARGYWAVATVPAVKFHDYYVNRLGSASSLSENWDESPATIYRRIYAFQLENDDTGRRTLPEDMTGRAVYIRRVDLPAELAS